MANMKSPDNMNAAKVEGSKLAKISESQKYKEFKLFEINEYEFMSDYDSVSKNSNFYTSHKVISDSATYVCFGIDYFLEQISPSRLKKLKTLTQNKRNHVEECFNKILRDLDGNFNYLFYIPPTNPRLGSRPISNYSTGVSASCGYLNVNKSCNNFDVGNDVENRILEDSVVSQNFNRKFLG